MNWLHQATQSPQVQAAIRDACQELAKQAVDRHIRNDRIRMILANNEQTRLIRLQLHQDRRKRIEAGIRALSICGRLRGDSRAVWTRRTLSALNRARRVTV